jgi:hypothetical protein
MNRHERRSAASDQRKWKGGEVIKTQSFKDAGGMLYWFEEPEGFAREDGLPSDVEIFGPFKTDAEVEKSQRLVLLGPQCQVTEGGMWNPAWDALQ